jgi:hypothetical protein
MSYADLVKQLHLVLIGKYFGFANVSSNKPHWCFIRVHNTTVQNWGYHNNAQNQRTYHIFLFHGSRLYTPTCKFRWHRKSLSFSERSVPPLMFQWLILTQPMLFKSHRLLGAPLPSLFAWLPCEVCCLPEGIVHLTYKVELL